MEDLLAATATRIITIALAIIGTVTGSIALGLSAASYLRDRPKIQITFACGYRAHNAPPYDPNKDFALVSISNSGRRPVYISLVYLEFPGDFDGIVNDSLQNPQTFPEGGAPATYLTDEEELKKFANSWPVIRAIAIDAAGKHYRSKRLSKKPKWGKDLRWYARVSIRLRGRWDRFWLRAQVTRRQLNTQ